ncbi:hypothetical protein N510_002589 [Firmicutes bacterium ASF500]|nr:hypothetical protein N510_002589 [Firmicutes bacterium ASF500]
MERYTVQITDEALSDLEEIYRYIAEQLQAPETAVRQYRRIADEILTLSSFPARYGTVSFEPERSAGLRRMLVDRYSVFYVIRDSHVVVTSILYSASDLERRLKDRL